MYAENRHALVPGLDQLVEQGDADGLLREIRKAVIAIAIDCDFHKRAARASGLDQITAALRAGAEASA